MKCSKLVINYYSEVPYNIYKSIFQYSLFNTRLDLTYQFNFSPTYDDPITTPRPSQCCWTMAWHLWLRSVDYTIYPVMSSYRRSDSGAVSRFSRTSDSGAWELTRYRVSHTRSWAIWLNASFYSIFNMWNYWQSIGQCKQRLTFWSGGISSHIL